MAKREPLYPHMPKRKEVQFPHTTGRVVEELQPGAATITQTELGGIRHVWVRLEGKPSVNVGRADEGLSRESLIERAKNYWAYEDKVKVVAGSLREKYNKQVYVGTLPTTDVTTDLSGNYAYVLKDRKKGGKFQIEEAVSLEVKGITPEVTIPKAITPAPEVTFLEAMARWQKMSRAERQSIALKANMPSTLAIKDWQNLKLFEKDAITNAMPRITERLIPKAPVIPEVTRAEFIKTYPYRDTTLEGELKSIKEVGEFGIEKGILTREQLDKQIKEFNAVIDETYQAVQAEKVAIPKADVS